VQSRKIVTILFTDVVGSTSLGEGLDAEVLRSVMTTYFDRMRPVLERHGGTVEKYIGDAIVAVFGIPQVHEDDALRAVRAAHDMRDALDALNGELQSRHGFRIEARTGVNTGEILAGDARPDAPLSADAANTAARLQQAAGPGEILLGEATLRLVRDAVTVEPVGHLKLKGKAQPLPAWRLVDVAPEGPGIARRLDSPIVGREAELDLLRRTFDRAVEAQACRLVTVVAAPGVGKSRLAAEFTKWLTGRAQVFRGRCLPYGDGITYWPVAEVAREAAGIAEEDPAELATSRIAALVANPEESATVAARLGSILGLIDEAAPTQEAFWAVRRLLENIAEQGPVVVVFDDIHWGEPTFLDLIEYLAGRSSGAPILLLCLARPELNDARPAWGAMVVGAESIRLDPLTDVQSEELIENLLGRAPLDEGARARIRNTAEGNPLFVEEILRMLVDQGLLRRVDGRWVAEGGLTRIDIPPTLGSLLAARLERLSWEERAVIQRAAVVGKVFWWGAVVELSPEHERPGVGGHLQALVRRELIRPEPSRFAAEDAFRFSHILVRDAAYAGTTKAARAELHERFSAWLERRAARRPAEFDEVVGYHLEQAHRYRTELGLDGETPRLAARAAERLASAGSRALERIDIHAAITLLSRAASLMQGGDPARVELLIDLTEALTEGGQVDRARETIRGAAAEADDLADERLATLVLLGQWYIKATEGPGDVGQAEVDGLRAVEVFRRHGDDRGLARAWALVGKARWWTGRSGAAEKALDQARRHARAAGDTRIEADSLLTLSAVLAQGPRPVHEAARLAEAIVDEYPGNRTVQAYMFHTLGHLRAWEGRFDEARGMARRYREILRENGQEASWADASECVADVELLAGDIDEAVRVVAEGQSRYDEMGISDPTILPFLAYALYVAGRWEEAEDPAVRAIGGDHPMWAMIGQSVLAIVRARQGRAEEAERLARQALDVARGTEHLGFRGRAAMALAEVLEILGREDEAIEYRDEAVRAFEEKGATVWAQLARHQIVEKPRCHKRRGS
jgi:class 3 adenylate cyclase/tetratricopeptide (TPR) repeat protein